jgi:hypothetical protein
LLQERWGSIFALGDSSGESKSEPHLGTPYRLGGAFFKSAWCLEEEMCPIPDIVDSVEVDFFDVSRYHLQPKMIESCHGLRLSILFEFQFNNNLTVCLA